MDPQQWEIEQQEAADQAERDKQQAELVRQENQKLQDEEDEKKFSEQKTESGEFKSSHQAIDPKEFGALENLQEAGNVVVGGAVDAYNGGVNYETTKT